MNLLERLLPKPGPARFVKLMVRALAGAGEAQPMDFDEKEKKEQRSIATWTETVDTLLPRVDAVVLNVPVGEKDCQAIGEVPRGRLVEVVGRRMVRQEGMYPERYRVATFPEREELERLGLQRS